MRELGNLRKAVAVAGDYVGCGDNSCLFKKPTGMATNGGCRCLGAKGDRPKPFSLQAMARLYKEAKAFVEGDPNA